MIADQNKPESREAWTTKDGTQVVIRPIRPEDQDMMVAFHQGLSPDTVESRYFSAFSLSERITDNRLRCVCHPDSARSIVLVVETALPGGERGIVGIGRLEKYKDSRTGEIALLVKDVFQRHGLGTELFRHLLQIGEAEHLTGISADILVSNVAMQRLALKLGMRLSYQSRNELIRAEMNFQRRDPIPGSK